MKLFDVSEYLVTLASAVRFAAKEDDAPVRVRSVAKTVAVEEMAIDELTV